MCSRRIRDSRTIKLQRQRGGASRLVTSDCSRARVRTVAGRSGRIRTDTDRRYAWCSAGRCLSDNSRDVCCRLWTSCSKPAKSEDSDVAEHDCRYDRGGWIRACSWKYSTKAAYFIQILQCPCNRERTQDLSILSCCTTPMLPIQESLNDLIGPLKWPYSDYA
jgi:hypothetical protein